MEVQLKVVGGANSGQAVKVPGPKFFIGRAEDCHLRPGSDLVSRHHCVILVEEENVVLRDFGSKNGTYVNGERVAAESELKHGDRLKIGPLEFDVDCSTASVAAKRPKVNSVAEAAVRTASDGVSGSSKDVDIGEWLKPGAGDDSGETKEINRMDTAELDMSSSTVVALPKPVEGAEDTTSSKAAWEKKPPGKLPPGARNNSNNSHDAAADMLKKLRKR